MSTTKLTEEYIAQRPSIKDCLKKGVINYTKLSRLIADDLNIVKTTSIEAILVACRRYSMKLKKNKILEDDILQLLRQSDLAIKNKIIVAIIKKPHYIGHLHDIETKIHAQADTFYAIEGTNVITIITSEKHKDTLKSMFQGQIVKLSEKLAMVNIRSPETLENTPGVVGFLCSIFSEHGVNVVEQMSCWTDTIFIVLEEDIPVVMNFLHFT